MAALPSVPDLPEWQDESWVARERYPVLRAGAAHAASAGRAGRRCPNEPPGRGSPMTNCWPASLRSRWCARICAAPPAAPRPARALRKKLIEALPYSLTPSQTRARRRHRRRSRQARADAAAAAGRRRLGQDRGGAAGRAAVIEGGRQAALMAPTEILARQHFNTIAPLAAAIGIEVAILTGRERGRERETILDRLALGDIHILVGTHALFQEDVEFRDLALAVVDEQHRFGVHQRLALARKGEAVDVLVMTATPIPRTLVLTYFGDMDILELREKAGRPAADRHPHDPARPARRGGRGRRPRARRGPARLLGVPAGRGIGEHRPRRRRGTLRRAQAAFRRPGRPRARPHEGGRQGPRHGALRGRARRGSWSPPR